LEAAGVSAAMCASWRRWWLARLRRMGVSHEF
jgi:hypothetical protein